MEKSVEFVLQMKKFEDNANTYWQKLRNEDCFSDVTLACVDQQVKAHRVVLSASSPVLENILKHSQHHNPFIYLGGVKYTDLISLLDFIYFGEVAINNEHIYDFLEIAKELEIKGLTDETIFDMEKIPPRKIKRKVYESSQNNLDNFPPNFIENSLLDSLVDELELAQNISKTAAKIANKSENSSKTIEINDKEINVKTNKYESEESKSLPNYTNYTTKSVVESVLNSADIKVNAHKMKRESNFELSENYDQDTSAHSTQKKICKLCSFKTDDTSDLDIHRQTIHQDRIFCEQCDFSAKTRGHLKHHVLSIHVGYFHNCDKCDYKSSEKNKVNRHKSAIHGEGTILYFCDECDYSAAVKNTLKRHKLSIHEGVKRAYYRCGECKYVTQIESRLEEHKVSRHDKL